ncbi:MAG TPA: SpoIIE family protein phosphatase [Bryobacteraceae bacterium]|nr:SpoIIE family protein phosphatase [Bryobacteraceae bacterium]
MSSALHAPAFQTKVRNQLVNRRARLESAIAELDRPQELLRLLTEVDSALSRLDGGTYGLCAVCETDIDEQDLLANPMARYCLCQMTRERQSALERDLDLAWHVQSALLPPPGLANSAWQTYYRYLPHGAVSGDYCDLIPSEDNLYFMVGDVSGKGVAASLLMAHLNAALRALAGTGLPPLEVMQRADRLLAESSLASHYATMVCGRASTSGEIEIVNAGHCPPILVRSGDLSEPLQATGLPLGLGIGAPPAAQYCTERIHLDRGDALVLYSDGLTEAANPDEQDYGAERLRSVLERGKERAPKEMVAQCLADLSGFLGGAERADDLTILILKRAE